MADRGSGQPKYDLTPMVNYGNAMSMRGDATGAGWFGPLAPLPPLAPPDVAGRQFDLYPGYNLQVRPRALEPVSFEKLRLLADAYDLLRIIIETRKDQVDRIQWTFRAKANQKVPQSRIDAVHKFFDRPDGEHDFQTWIRILLEDLFVIDAPTIWKEKARGGKLIGLHPVDGATIKRVIDDWGRTPAPPLPAYQQILKGYPAVDYTTDDLIYSPRNVRSNRVYGFSPVEQIIMTVNIALRRQVHQLTYYTEGNIPESLIGVPDNWNPDQIKAFQDYWDLYFTGDLAARRRAKFVPGGVAKTFIQTKEPELKNVFDEWLAKVCCYAFSVSSQAFTSQVNRATAGTQKEQAEEEGLVPVLDWIKRLVNRIIVDDLGEPNIEIAVGEDGQIDPATEATILVSYANNALMTRNEARERLGMDPDPSPEADLLGFTTATGFVPLDESKKPEPPPMLTLPGPGGVPTGEKPAGEKPLQNKGEQDQSGKQPKTDESVNKLFDLMKQEGHDVSDQPRDNHGRFASSGGPTSRERKKAERAANRKDDGVARDEHGRFAKGKVTKASVMKTAYSVGGKVAVAAALSGAAAAAVFFAPEEGAIALAAEGIAVVARQMASSLVVQSSEKILETIMRGLGADAEFAKKAAKIARKTVADMIKAKASKAAESTDSEPTDDDMKVVMQIAQWCLPKMIDKYISALETQIDEKKDDYNPEHVKVFLQQLEQVHEELVSGLKALGKSDEILDLAKGYRKLKPLSMDRPAIRKATRAAKQTLSEAFQTAGKRAATLVAGRLGDRVVAASKAAGDPSSPDAIAAALDLNAIEEIAANLGDDLARASSDAAQRTLVQIGPDLSDDLVGQSSESAAKWARDHAAELLGKKVLDDGTFADQEVDGYTITDSTRKMVRDIIASGLENGDSTDDIIQKIQDVGFSEERAATIAETEVGNANSAGTLQAYQDASDAGVPVMKAWLTTGDEKVDEDICKANEEQGPIPIDQPFQSGHMAPLGHTRCRCTLVACVSDEGDNES